MKLLSVNRSQAQPITVGEKVDQTGIFKTPTGESVRVDKLGLAGDVQVSKKHHGGPDQAVYLYSARDYAWFSELLGRELSPGTFGENLTFSEFPAEVYVGDRFQVGEVLLEVTAPRIPCATFAARMGEPTFVETFKQAERPGVYARVITEGSVQAGDEVVYSRGQSDVSTLEMFRLHYTKPTLEQLERLLKAPIAERARETYEEELVAH